MDLGLKGKTAIVTGAASNIGKAIAVGLFGEGANVVIIDLDVAQAEKVVADLNGNSDGNEAMFVKADVGNREEVGAMAEAVMTKFGSVEILVNNAGWTANNLFLNKPYSDFEKEVSINLWGPINCIHAIAPSMIESKYGKIVNIGSDAGRVGEYNEAVYGACKAGLISLTKTLAIEFGKHGLNLNCVCPGLTLPDNPAADAGIDSLWHPDSPQSKIFRDEETMKKVVKHYPLRRHGVPEDLVPMVMMMASDKTSYVTGQTISVSGGYAM
ncbi:MAG: SDR family oxidoreductase [Rhodospirillales bacterium]|jgi:2-hydroxycyclohexanecarboxyl-CoA dehydrogenase|nr:SDR family oxidoreductase [Rhodospirillales bacterium]MBT4039355.1 SDR family oxidoreductase [Rhodospirillales bacterium]MBT4626243.1 SDR family oxidoreductase [Rhodospirillales bacterium]MBT5353088.1 SDR family oxidoreductase [Rhodospirillales bacterium]MBT5520775.1 SDR family oxidoreductase [Rhodospirillales bacterium]